MDLQAQPYTFKALFASKKVFSIPRYQREFSWGKQELLEMYNDVVKRLNNVGGTIKTTEYFFGNIILQGDMKDSGVKELSIIDGQQRFTAVTIFLSSLASMFKKAKKPDLEEGIKQYIIGKDDNNQEYPVFVNETPAPFFQFKVQGMDPSAEPKTDEEKRIASALTFFNSKLKKEQLQSDLLYLGLGSFDYIEALKAVRDQLLGSYVICCWTTMSEYANLVFEIMNAKGLELASIDLIKNYIFSILIETVPADYASEKWKIINKNLMERDARIPFSIFFRHYWNSTYGKISDKDLFPAFKRKFSTKEECKELLADLEKMSIIYVHCIKPSLTDYGNKNQYLHLVESLSVISDVLNVIMPRVFLMNLLDKYNSKIISTKIFEKALSFIEKYHFIYNGVCSERTNRLEKTYCDYATKLKACTTKEECSRTINGFQAEMVKYLPQFDTFYSLLGQLKYSSKIKLPSNIMCKYFVSYLERKASNMKNRKQDSSIEHILGEDEDDETTLLLPFLMEMQRDDNSRIPSDCPVVKKFEYYLVSTYSYAKDVGIFLRDKQSVQSIKEKLEQQFKINAKSFYESVK